MKNNRYFFFPIPIFFFIFSPLSFGSQTVVNDVSRLKSIQIYETIKIKNNEDVIHTILYAKDKKLKISIAGKKHSQGGHIAFDNVLLLDMLEFNKILSLDQKEKIIKVQSGTTWAEIQEYINQYGLAIKVMQSSNIFTIGGSLSSNIHGRDPHYGPIIESVKSFRLATSDGKILNVSREENTDLFRLAIGGYGLFGVILDVDLELTDNEVYEKTSDHLNYKEYPEFLRNKIIGDSKVGLHFARISFASSSLLEGIYSTTYRHTDKKPESILALNKEKNILRNKIIFDLSRRFSWGKELRWFLQNKYADLPSEHVLSRNNAMRPPIEFLDYHSNANTDILQEYFIPLDNFISFIDNFRDLIKKHHINLLSVTLRYVSKNQEAFLSYSKVETIGVVLYINQELSDEGKRQAEIWTRALVNLSLRAGGTYYLTYQLYPTIEQMHQAYPEANDFFRNKKTFDSDELFINYFYMKYNHAKF